MLTQQWQGEWPGVGVSHIGIVECIVIINQQRLAGGDDWLAVVTPDIARGLFFLLGGLLPGSVFLLVEHVFGVREGRDPTAIAEHRVPAAMIDVQVGAEDVVDFFELQSGGLELVEIALLGEVHWRGVAFILTGAGVHQDRVVRRADDKRLIGDDHHAGGRVEYFRV